MSMPPQLLMKDHHYSLGDLHSTGQPHQRDIFNQIYPATSALDDTPATTSASFFITDIFAKSHDISATMPVHGIDNSFESFHLHENSLSLSPDRRSSTRTLSTSSSNKSSMSRVSVSSKSSAPSSTGSARKRRTRSSAKGSTSSTTTAGAASATSSDKRDKFLERNRVAASKCRQRKKEWVNGLEEAKVGLETQNSHLQMEFNALLGEVSRMKNQIMAHASCQDPNIDKWIDNEARRFVQGPESSTEYPGVPVSYPPFPNPAVVAAAPPPPPFPMDYNGFGEEGSRVSSTEPMPTAKCMRGGVSRGLGARRPEAVSG